ncbi:MAG TPA: immunoglobulin domain-containing protein [Burkholderiaceae bacterium]|nr:immunoglobulin domain-containing protein [Burkholderiaceae bacterium]
MLYKSNAQGGWEAVPGATLGAGTVSGQVTSFSFFVVGNQPPLITRQPADANVVEPNVATFAVTALGTPPFTYRWERSDDGGMTFVDAGGRADRFTTPPTTVRDGNADRYRVIVGNLEGSSESRVATLTVSVTAVAPSITTQPQDATVNVDDNVTFTVVASGTSPAYQWQRWDDDSVMFIDIAGATNASLTLTNVQAGDNDMRFRARVSNSAGSVTSRAARLTVVGTPPGGRFTLTVTLSGNFGELWGFGPNDRQVPSLQCINSPGGPNPCSEPYAAGSQVRLEPQTFVGSVEWTGCDRDNGNAGCIVDMNSDRSVTATFR